MFKTYVLRTARIQRNEIQVEVKDKKFQPQHSCNSCNKGLWDYSVYVTVPDVTEQVSLGLTVENIGTLSK
jgi:hypothetical protein